MSATTVKYKVTLNNGEPSKTFEGTGCYVDRGWLYINNKGIPVYMAPERSVAEVERVDA